MTHRLKTLFGTLMLFLMINIIQTKKLSKKYPISQLADAPQTIYLSKFGVSSAGGSIIVKFKKYGQNFPQLYGLKLGLLLDTNFYDHKYAKTCQQKQEFYKQTHILKFFNPTEGMQSIKISKNNKDHLYLVYIYTCDYVDVQQGNDSLLNIDLIMNNNGIEMEEYGILFWCYGILVALIITIAAKFSKRVFEHIQTNKNISSYFMCGGFILITLAVFTKFLQVFQYIISGEDRNFFGELYIVLKCTLELVMTTILMSIAWGWLLNNKKYKYPYLGIIIGVTVLNIILQLMADSNKQEISQQNLYQGFFGKIVLILRIIISLIFVSGCLYVSLKTDEKRQAFINNFAQVGSAYLLTNIISLLISQIFVHSYHHGSTIPVLDDILKTAGIVYFCYLFAYPKQDLYQQIGFGFQFNDDNNSCLEPPQQSTPFQDFLDKKQTVVRPNANSENQDGTPGKLQII